MPRKKRCQNKREEFSELILKNAQVLSGYLTTASERKMYLRGVRIKWNFSLSTYYLGMGFIICHIDKGILFFLRNCPVFRQMILLVLVLNEIHVT